MTLYIFAYDDKLRNDMIAHTNKRRVTDSGFDLLSPKTTLRTNETNLGLEIQTGVYCAALSDAGEPVPYLLLARSSTSLTPLRMSNQIGLADAGYRGQLIARVDCLDTKIETYEIEHGRRLFQLVQHNWLPWNNIVFVNRLEDLPAPPDTRGNGGFGSTGN